MSVTEEEKDRHTKELRELYPDIPPEDREKAVELLLKQRSHLSEVLKIAKILDTRNLPGRRRRQLIKRQLAVLRMRNRFHLQFLGLIPSNWHMVVTNNGAKAQLEPLRFPQDKQECSRDTARETARQFLARFPVGSKVPPIEMYRKYLDSDLEEEIRASMPLQVSRVPHENKEVVLDQVYIDSLYVIRPIPRASSVGGRSTKSRMKHSEF
jgi:hypothetical protein